MQIRELERIKEIDFDIHDLLSQLYALQSNSKVRGQIITDMPKGGATKDSMCDYVAKKIQVEEEIKALNNEKEILIDKATEFINSIKDEELQDIIYNRNFLGKTWEQIGFDIGIDRTNASRKYKNFFKQLEIDKLKKEYAR